MFSDVVHRDGKKKKRRTQERKVSERLTLTTYIKRRSTLRTLRLWDAFRIKTNYSRFVALLGGYSATYYWFYSVPYTRVLELHASFRSSLLFSSKFRNLLS